MTSNQTNGLRLTIATVKKPGSPSGEKIPDHVLSESDEGDCYSSNNGDKRVTKIKSVESGKDAGIKSNVPLGVGKTDKKADLKGVKKETSIVKGTVKGKTKSRNLKKVSDLWFSQ